VAATEPDALLNWPVMAACPSRGSEPVISEAKSVKLAFIAVLEIVVPDEKELLTEHVPDPFLGTGVPP
jgi:hypothetical protein